MSQEPEAAIRAYVRAFESLDQEAVVPFYHLPCMFIGPLGVAVASDADAARGMASLLIEHARSQGYRRTEIHDLKTSLLGESLASGSGAFARLNSSGEEISRFGFTYLLRKDAAGWKIVVAAAHEASPHAAA